MIKVVLFDVGGTLITPNPSVGGVYSMVAAKHGLTLDAELLQDRFKKAWTQEKSSRHVVDKNWWRRIVELVFTPERPANFESFFEDLYMAFEKKDAWTIFGDALPTLIMLQKQNVRMAIASNWDSRLPALLDILELSPFFEKQFISFQLGMVKPDLRFFQKALHEMNVDPLETIHVGDDAEEDIVGAEKAGIRAYLIDRHKKPTNSRALVNLEEILLRI